MLDGQTIRHMALEEIDALFAGEEGAVQVFKPLQGSDLILGAVGVLQFDVAASRLMK